MELSTTMSGPSLKTTITRPTEAVRTQIYEELKDFFYEGCSITPRKPETSNIVCIEFGTNQQLSKFLAGFAYIISIV